MNIELPLVLAYVSEIQARAVHDCGGKSKWRHVPSSQGCSSSYNIPMYRSITQTARAGWRNTVEAGETLTSHSHDNFIENVVSGVYNAYARRRVEILSASCLQLQQRPNASTVCSGGRPSPLSAATVECICCLQSRPNISAVCSSGRTFARGLEQLLGRWQKRKSCRPNPLRRSARAAELLARSLATASETRVAAARTDVSAPSDRSCGRHASDVNETRAKTAAAIVGTAPEVGILGR